jgi:hypothetical protein
MLCYPVLIYVLKFNDLKQSCLIVKCSDTIVKYIRATHLLA